MEGMQYIVIALMVLLLHTTAKWISYKLSVEAILLYFAEQGADLPDMQTIQEYRIRVAKKWH